MRGNPQSPKAKLHLVDYFNVPTRSIKWDQCHVDNGWQWLGDHFKEVLHRLGETNSHKPLIFVSESSFNMTVLFLVYFTAANCKVTRNPVLTPFLITFTTSNSGLFIMQRNYRIILSLSFFCMDQMAAHTKATSCIPNCTVPSYVLINFGLTMHSTILKRRISRDRSNLEPIDLTS